MNRSRAFFLIGGWLLFLCGTAADAQTIEYDNPPFGVGARMAALAESDISEARDVSGMYWNPASLSSLHDNTVFGTYQFTPDLTNALAAFSVILGRTDVIAVGGLMTQFPSISDYPKRGTSASPVQYGVDLAYSHKFNYALSMGIRLSGRYGQLQGADGIITGFGGIGIFYEPNTVFSYGAVYNEVGSGIDFLNTAASSNFSQEHLPGSVEVGVVMHYPSVTKYRMLTMSISNEKIINTYGESYKFGLEILPVPYGAVRFGYYVEPTMTRPTYGAGLHFGSVSVDYAYVPHKYNFEMHQFSIVAAF